RGEPPATTDAAPPLPPPKFPEGLRPAEGYSQRGGPARAAADRSPRPVRPHLAAAWHCPGAPLAPPMPNARAQCPSGEPAI
ncbi:X-linked retinitis pigmentosa GTPase regulator-interacting protein 1, partial [Manis javanica]